MDPCLSTFVRSMAKRTLQLKPLKLAFFFYRGLEVNCRRITLGEGLHSGLSASVSGAHERSLRAGAISAEAGSEEAI